MIASHITLCCSSLVLSFIQDDVLLLHHPILYTYILFYDITWSETFVSALSWRRSIGRLTQLITSTLLTSHDSLSLLLLCCYQFYKCTRYYTIHYANSTRTYSQEFYIFVANCHYNTQLQIFQQMQEYVMSLAWYDN